MECFFPTDPSGHIDESKHYVTSQFHPEHHGLYPEAVNTLVGSKPLFTCIGHGNSTCFIAIQHKFNS